MEIPCQITLTQWCLLSSPQVHRHVPSPKQFTFLLIDNDLFSIGTLQANAAPLLINRGVDYETVTSYSLNISIANRQMGVGQPCRGAASKSLSWWLVTLHNVVVIMLL